MKLSQRLFLNIRDQTTKINIFQELKQNPLKILNFLNWNTLSFSVIQKIAKLMPKYTIQHIRYKIEM